MNDLLKVTESAAAMRHMRAARKAAVNLVARSEMMDQKITDMYELLDSIEVIIEAADPAKRKALAQTIDAFAENFPEDFYWAVGPQAPTLLHHLLSMIDAACRPEAQSKPRGAIRLVDRKSEGNA